MMQINQVLDSWFNKGFRGPKCKTLLKLATSRIKLLRNKRAIQLKQLRRELALLLENGQESTARIRVEHIIREKNTMEAYDSLELFCELLIVRMPIIESQRECPLDLQEAVASLIFAAPRASDLPELLEVQNMLSFKYGKEFVAAATELRTDCNVNRLVIEKLSTRAPTMEVKLDLMKEIAEEHDIEWDSASTELEFSKPPEDLLDGPKHFVGPIQMWPIPHDGDDVHADHLNSDSSFQEQGSSLPSAPKGRMGKSSTHLQSVDPIEETKFIPFVVSPSNYGTETMPGRFYSPPRESSITQQSDLLEETLIQRSLSRTKSEGSMNLQEIIEAAEAAAVCAEKAARAARAAAELARSRISPRCSKDIKHEEVMPQITSETDQDIPSVVEFNMPQITSETDQDIPSVADTGNGKTSIQRIPDSYDWTQGGEVSHVEPMVEDKSHPKGDGGSAFDQYGENNYSYDDMPLLNHQLLVKGEIPFSEDGKLFTSATSDWLGHDEESEGGRQPVYDAPSFDGAGTSSHPEPFQRLPSLEDDPYYTYPNLFSKPSSGSTTSS